MFDLKPSRGFHHVESAGDIGVEKGAGVVDAVTHARLRREVDDHVWLKVIGQRIEGFAVFQQRLFGREMLMLKQHRVAALFQGDVVVVGHPVIALHPRAFGQQQAGKVKADEAARAGDQYPLRAVHSGILAHAACRAH